VNDENSLVSFLFVLFNQTSDIGHVNMVHDTIITEIQEFNYVSDITNIPA
jgi:hypothetical protein